jgi:hypothetical protein
MPVALERKMDSQEDDMVEQKTIAREVFSTC